MGATKINDVLLSTNVMRLPPQYDAPGFLQTCPVDEQYRILASICRSESYLLSQKQSNYSTKGHSNTTDSLGYSSQQQCDGISNICYASRLIAFMSGRGRWTAPLNMLREEQAKKKEEEERELQLKCQKQDEEAAEAEAEQEIWYDEEGGYYYDKHGYYDAEGNYYYFETGNGEEQVDGTTQEVEAGEERAEASHKSQSEIEPQGLAEAQRLWSSEDPFEADRQEGVENDTGATLPKYLRVLPDESQWANLPFLRGFCTLQRAAQQLEQSLPPVDVFLRDSGVIPLIPVSVVAESHTYVEEVETLCPRCIYVLASRQYLHIVYVPPSYLAQQQQVDEADTDAFVTSLLNRKMQAGVLMSIPLNGLGGKCTASCGSLGNGRVLLEIYVKQGELVSEEDNDVTLSMVFGIPSDSTFLTLPLASRLVDCYEQRVLHYLAKSGCTLDEIVAAEVGNRNNSCFYTTDPSRPLFSYSALFIMDGADNNTSNENVEQSLVYDEVSNSLLHNKEREAADRKRKAREETFYLARNMEPPQWRYLREALEVLQVKETEDRAVLRAAAMEPYESNHWLSFKTIATVELPFLRTQEVEEKRLLANEQRQWEGLLRHFAERHKSLVADETRRRLEEQFAFERRLQLLQCSINFDLLAERETASRAILERDEVQERCSGELLECWILLLTCRRMMELQRSALDENEATVATSPLEEQRLARVVSRTSNSQRPQRSSLPSAYSPTTEEFMRAVTDGYRSSLTPSGAYPSLRARLSTA